MPRSRLIPILLIDEGKSLVKTKQLKTPRYIGDPINTIKLFNDKHVDELIILEISRSSYPLDLNFLGSLANEARMPLCYGGGISSISEFEALTNLGFEKIAVGTALLGNYELVLEAAEIFGSQSVVAIVNVIEAENLSSDVRYVVTDGSGKQTDIDLIDHIRNLVEMGAGEILVHHLGRDGTREGFDKHLIQKVRTVTNTPITIAGGCRDFDNIIEVNSCFPGVGIGVGSAFVFKGRLDAVLIQYPNEIKLRLV